LRQVQFFEVFRGDVALQRRQRVVQQPLIERRVFGAFGRWKAALSRGQDLEGRAREVFGFSRKRGARTRPDRRGQARRQQAKTEPPGSVATSPPNPCRRGSSSRAEHALLLSVRTAAKSSPAWLQGRSILLQASRRRERPCN